MTEAVCERPTERCVPSDGKRQQRLLHGYLHKTSNSLCGIKGYASLIAAEHDCEGRMGRWAKKIVAEVEQMERVYRSIREMAFPRPEEMLDVAGAGDLVVAVEEAALAARREHPGLEIKCAVPLTGSLSLPARDLVQVLAEILNNAAEGNGNVDDTVTRVVVRSLLCDGMLRLEICDDGCGMSADLLDQAAHPFITTKTGHLGTGLSRVDTIMDMYGLAWAITSRPGNGTSVLLEIASAPAQAPAPGQPARKDIHG